MQPAHERNGNANTRHLGDVVEVDLQPLVRDSVDQSDEIVVEAIVRDALEVEGRQGHGARTAKLHRVPGELDGIREVGQSGAWDHAGRVDPGPGQGLQHPHALVHPDRQRLAGRAEGRETDAAIGQTPLGMRHIEVLGDRHIVIEGGQRGRNHPAQRCAGRHGSVSPWSFP